MFGVCLKDILNSQIFIEHMHARTHITDTDFFAVEAETCVVSWETTRDCILSSKH